MTNFSANAVVPYDKTFPFGRFQSAFCHLETPRLVSLQKIVMPCRLKSTKL